MHEKVSNKIAATDIRGTRHIEEPFLIKNYRSASKPTANNSTNERYSSDNSALVAIALTSDVFVSCLVIVRHIAIGIFRTRGHSQVLFSRIDGSRIPLDNQQLTLTADMEEVIGRTRFSAPSKKREHREKIIPILHLKIQKNFIN